MFLKLRPVEPLGGTVALDSEKQPLADEVLSTRVRFSGQGSGGREGTRGSEQRTAIGAHAGHATAPLPSTGDVPQTRLVHLVLRWTFLGLVLPPTPWVAGWADTGSRADRGAGPS